MENIIHSDCVLWRPMGSVFRFDFIPIGKRSKVLLLLAIPKFMSCLWYEVSYHLNSSLKSLQPSQLIPDVFLTISSHPRSLLIKPSQLIPEASNHASELIQQFPTISNHTWSLFNHLISSLKSFLPSQLQPSVRWISLKFSVQAFLHI